MNFKTGFKLILFIAIFAIFINLNVSFVSAGNCCIYHYSGGLTTCNGVSGYCTPLPSGASFADYFEDSHCGGTSGMECIQNESEPEPEPEPAAAPPTQPTTPATPQSTVADAPQSTVSPDNPSTPSSGGTLVNPLGSGRTFESVINSVVTATLGLTGVLALLAFIYGGITWMTSYGDPGKITKGKTAMIWAVAGLVIIFSAYAIITFVFDALGI